MRNLVSSWLDVVLVMHIFCLKLNHLVDLNAGSKEENFFDSQAWLESDCEDDFYSVRGGKSSKNSLASLSC